MSEMTLEEAIARSENIEGLWLTHAELLDRDSEVANSSELATQHKQTARITRRNALAIRTMRNALTAAQARIAELEGERDKATERAKEAVELLRSACAIAERKGEGTAWDRFISSVHKLGLNGITARTYRVLPHESTEAPDA